VVSIVVLCIFMGLGHLVRTKVKLLQRMYLPSCVIGGVLGLFFLRMLFFWSGGGAYISELNIFRGTTFQIWRQIPGVLINVVFACLFLGMSLPRVTRLWKISSRQLAYGQIVAWGQYVVALGLWVVVLGRLFPDLPAMFAGILPIGFEGGHGTAAGLGETFTKHHWYEGQDLALSSATFGIVSAILVGTILINWAAARGHLENITKLRHAADDNLSGIIPPHERPSAGRLTVDSDAIESLSLHLVAVGLAVGVGLLIKQGLIRMELHIPYLAQRRFFHSFPLFPLCMIGGFIVQWVEMHFDRHRLIDPGLIRRIQNTALDFLVIAAIATIRVEVVAYAIQPLLILVAAGILWNVFCVSVLARRIFKDAWFERAIAEMGQSMGVTATGLLLLRVVDPDYETNAAEAFACKQILHEPFMGGGLWTSAAIPLIAIYGPRPVLAIAAGAIVVWVMLLTIFRRRL